MGIPSFLIKYCNASAPAYYDSNWFVTRTRHSRSNLLNRIFITRGRRTVYSSSAWLTKETVHPLPSHYNKNKHSFRGFLYASGAMLILYQTIKGYLAKSIEPPGGEKLSRPTALYFRSRFPYGSKCGSSGNLCVKKNADRFRRHSLLCCFSLIMSCQLRCFRIQGHKFSAPCFQSIDVKFTV